MTQTTFSPPAFNTMPRCDRRDRRGGFVLTILVFAALAAVAFVTSRTLPPWAAMWATAFTIYAVCKAATWLQLPSALRNRRRMRSAAYLLAWPGMDAAAFLDDRA